MVVLDKGYNPHSRAASRPLQRVEFVYACHAAHLQLVSAGGFNGTAKPWIALRYAAFLRPPRVRHE